MWPKIRSLLNLVTLTFIGLALPLSQASATIYKWVDEQGNVSYSDTPHAGAQQLDLPSQTEMPETQIGEQPKTQSQEQSPVADAMIQYQISLSAPLQEATIWTGNGDVEVQASVDPAPQSDMKYQFLVDGKPYLPQPQTSSYVTLTNVDRGTHELQVQLLNAQDKVIATSNPPVKVYVHRPSLLNQPARQQPLPLNSPLLPLSNTPLPVRPPTPQPLNPPIQPLQPPRL